MTGLVLDPRTLRLPGDRAVLSPTGRLLRLADGALARALAGEPAPAVRALADVLVDAGAAHPLPEPHPADDVTVVVPVKDRPTALARCLAALAGADVLVVDDGSVDAVAVAQVCRAYGARLVRRDNGGPAAARNTALPLLDKGFVAFLDSDCVPPPGWLEALRGHLEDERVAAVAPRVSGAGRSPLDQGPHPGLVRPGSPVGYVPTAALLVRRSALTPFDEALRYGEDVDLVWRTVAAGWQVRYDPRVVVAHEEPARLVDRLVRRYRYGTSAAPLSDRHPGAVTHLVVPPWPTAAVALLLARRPVLALAVAGVTAARLQRHLGDPATTARVTARSVAGTAEGLGRALSLAGPPAWAAAARRPRVALLLALPFVTEWWRRRPAVGPLRYTAIALGDQAAYGAGVVAGCARHRTWRPLRPRTR